MDSLDLSYLLKAPPPPSAVSGGLMFNMEVGGNHTVQSKVQL